MPLPRGNPMGNIDLYLDLDGVILRRTGNTEFGGRTEFDVAPGAMEFMSWAIGNFNCYWLTTRSQDGSYEEIERAFRFAIPTTNIAEETKKLIKAIRPARWAAGKIDGIDISREFFWLDDNPDQPSVDALKEARLLDRLITVSTDRQPEDLVRVRKMLASAVCVH
jgi:hypothetical protein